MAADIQYKLFLNDEIATADQLRRFENISVEQEMDHGYSASFEIPIVTDDLGNWTGETEDFVQELSRVRLAISLRGGDFVPLIDGSIVTVNYSMSMNPGESMLTLDVQDDGFLLHRDETVQLFQGKPDDQIATEIYQQSDDIDDTDVDEVKSAADTSQNTIVLRGTQMELLQALARRQNMHAYVLPGDDPHTSIGCFKNDPVGDSGLPAMVLLGAKRNLQSIRISSSASFPATYKTSAVNLGDKSVNSSTANLDDVDRDGADAPAGSTVKRLLRPGDSWNVDLESATLGASQQASYAIRAEGEVLRDTYPAVLQPYQNVQVLGVNGRWSGLWMIRQVTHTITRNSYGQTFQLQRNAQSAGDGNSPPSAPRSIS